MQSLLGLGMLRGINLLGRDGQPGCPDLRTREHSWPDRIQPHTRLSMAASGLTRFLALHTA
jgi:hypothetical protein